jgi:Glycosyl hydrolases family 15
MPPTRAARGRRSDCRPISRSASKATAPALGMFSRPVRSATARCRGPKGWPHRATSRRPAPASTPPGDFGATGWDVPEIPDHRWRDPLQRSALAIKGMTYLPTGATVAALTTSLPETPGGERNWDYRYTWMRDTTFTLQALHFLNLDWEADEFMQFVADLEPNQDGALQIMYGIDGRRDLTESCPAMPVRDPCGSATERSTNARTTSSAPYGHPRARRGPSRQRIRLRAGRRPAITSDSVCESLRHSIIPTRMLVGTGAVRSDTRTMMGRSVWSARRGQRRQRIAIGLTGDPVAAGRRSGAMTHMKDQRPCSSQRASSASKCR